MSRRPSLWEELAAAVKARAKPGKRTPPPPQGDRHIGTTSYWAGEEPEVIRKRHRVRPASPEEVLEALKTKLEPHELQGLLELMDSKVAQAVAAALAEAKRGYVSPAEEVEDLITGPLKLDGDLARAIIANKHEISIGEMGDKHRDWRKKRRKRKPKRKRPG